MGLVRGSSQPGVELASPASPAWAGSFFTTSNTWEPSLSVGQPHISCTGKRILNHWTTTGGVLGCLGKASEQPVPLLSGGELGMCPSIAWSVIKLLMLKHTVGAEYPSPCHG